MQGGIRRKNDLLPRYKKSGNYKDRSAPATSGRTARRIALYAALLGLVYLAIRVVYADRHKTPQFELAGDGTFAAAVAKPGVAVAPVGNTGTNANANANAKAAAAGAAPPPPGQKVQFNNEVAKQQEVKNLENEVKGGGAAPAAAAAAAAAAVAAPGAKGVGAKAKGTEDYVNPNAPIIPPPNAKANAKANANANANAQAKNMLKDM